MSETRLGLTPNPWSTLRRFTQARIALGRAGTSQPTAAHLDFQLAHARARDAVHLALDTDRVVVAIESLGLRAVRLQSAAADRDIYLQRPDLGRRLDAASRAALELLHGQSPASARYDVAFVIADGLSALAIHENAAPLLAAMQARLSRDEWRIAPVAVTHQGRVAIGDEVGELLGANLVVVLIGERPGLSSPNSLGIYLTWAPRVGLTDAARNCISNVRAEGLSIEKAATKLHYLMSEARQRQLTGVELKDNTAASLQGPSQTGNFLLAPPTGTDH